METRVCIIPARMASSRFPGKPLAPLLGMPLILHVWHRCRLAGAFDRILVATCDREIADCVEQAGGEAVMTADTHERCTDRVAEALEVVWDSFDPKGIVVMVQGDEVLVDPGALAEMPDIITQQGAAAVNLLSPIADPAEGDDVNVVKAATALDGRVVYLSRSPIPSRSRTPDVGMLQQTGVIAFTALFLETFSRLQPTPLEIAESIDMLRLIEHGLPLYSVIGAAPTIGVDTESDRLAAERVLRDNPWTAQYLQPASV